jgi:2-polyprenyl-3-methyl-5-hydroxy-6-metoxy-1,4-benzoquinol methylase
MKGKNLLRRIGRGCFSKGSRLWEANSKQWDYPLTKWEKLWCGGYLILRDYADGIFPPQFEDQAKAYQNEIDYNAALPGYDLAEAQKSHAIKPFWNAAASRKYLGDFNRIFHLLQSHGVNPGCRLLELGCGSGWMAELLATAGYSTVGTTISPYDVVLADKKAEAFKCKGLGSELRFRVQPMESVDEMPDSRGAFDAAYVYEALHHAYDWRKALRATAGTLKEGGWLLLANEPNRLHTYISYRVAKLSHTHEMGFSKRELLHELSVAGFSNIEVLQPRCDDWLTQFWIMARRASG